MVKYLRAIETFKKCRAYFIRQTMKFVNLLYCNKYKIVFDNFEGRGYGDNPKYIAEEIISQHLKYDIVWIVRKNSQYVFPECIRTVRTNSIRMIYELATAKFWIDNCRKPRYVGKTKKQKYIQTWHGFYPLKLLEKDAQNSLPYNYINQAKNDSQMTDLMLSGCKARTNIQNSAFWYEGEVAEWGNPRNDVFFKDVDYKQKVCAFFSIQPNKKMVIYAPTFRDNRSIEPYNIDFETLKHSLSLKFGGEWVCLVRLHPNIREKSSFVHYSESLIDASNYDDIQELFVACDVLISDYSDCMFEFSLTNKPVFLYASDLNEYISGRNFYYNIHELPFEIAESNDELKNKIESFDELNYCKLMDDFHEKIGVIEKGTASKSVVNYIIKNT